MRNLAILTLSVATALSGIAPAYAYPTMTANDAAKGSVIQVVDQGHDWKHNLQDDPQVPRRRDDRRRDDNRSDNHRNDRHHDDSRNDHRDDHHRHHHNNIGAILGGAAAGAIIGGAATAPQRRDYDDRDDYDDQDDGY